MTPRNFERGGGGSERHALWAFVAVALSLGAHLLCMYLFSDYMLGGGSALGRQAREWFDATRVPPMRVERMQADPMHLVKRVPGEQDLPSRGPLDSSDKVEALNRSENVVMSVPPPIPREALQPGVPALKEVLGEQIDTTPWMPRQEIAQIYDRSVQDELAALPRRELPQIERVQIASDIVPSIDLVGRRFGRDPEPPQALASAEVFDTQISRGTFKIPVAQMPRGDSKLATEATEDKFALQPGERAAALEPEQVQKRIAQQVRQQLGEQQQGAVSHLSEEEQKALEAQTQIATLQEMVEYVPIDDMLAIGLEVFKAAEEPDKLYFRIGIQPRGDRPVQVIAKDIVFVQDASGSMGEERMVFCRRALLAALESLNAGDRFNVVAFRDTFENCFGDWAEATEENLKRARNFTAGMRSFGQTDLFGSLRAMLRMSRDPRRPMIAVVITDGMPTFGLTKSAEIIGEFSRINSGIASVYMYGVHKKANGYLLDMLSYSNRGFATIMYGNRWDIPAGFQPLYEGLRNPVMGDITLAFDSASRCEVYPKNTTNLYKDRQLEVVGCCPEGTGELIFQLRGLASDKGYDSIFRLNVKRHGKAGAPQLRQRWAAQKMYHLVSSYAREKNASLLEQMRAVNRQYGIPIPYEEEL